LRLVPLQVCTNSVGSYACSCTTGFFLEANKFNCTGRLVKPMCVGLAAQSLVTELESIACICAGRHACVSECVSDLRVSARDLRVSDCVSDLWGCQGGILAQQSPLLADATPKGLPAVPPQILTHVLPTTTTRCMMRQRQSGILPAGQLHRPACTFARQCLRQNLLLPCWLCVC
jgi:hypothetical protein